VKTLTSAEISIAESTISSRAFYYLTHDALTRGQGLSVVRMGDGERQLAYSCMAHLLEPEKIVSDFDEEWRVRLGVEGITYGLLWRRMKSAANLSKYFAPNINGLVMPEQFGLYHLFEPRKQYVDNFFCNDWTPEQLIALYKEARHVLFIHANRGLADAFQIRLKNKLGVKLSYLQLAHWRDAENVANMAKAFDAPLVIFSAGPASKWIAVELEQQRKVALDVGNSAEIFALPSLQDN
jgi:hypothetical protein